MTSRVVVTALCDADTCVVVVTDDGRNTLNHGQERTFTVYDDKSVLVFEEPVLPGDVGPSLVVGEVVPAPVVTEGARGEVVPAPVVTEGAGGEEGPALVVGDGDGAPIDLPSVIRRDGIIDAIDKM